MQYQCNHSRRGFAERNRVCDFDKLRGQLARLSPPPATPDSPIRFEPAPWPSAPRLSVAICCYCDRSFGGLYTPGEVAVLAAYFRDWPGRIEPGQFEQAADIAIAGGAA